MYVWKQLSPSIPHELQFGLACGLTDIGPVRHSNEDNFLIDPALGLAAVADGMGGHDGGEIASADALTWLSHFLRATMFGTTSITNFRPSSYDPVLTAPQGEWTEDTVRAMVTLHQAVEFTNQRMYQTNVDNRRGDGAGMGTTLSGLWQASAGGPLLVFHIGDTRLYRFRDGGLTLLTRDHTMYQHALDAGMHDHLPSRNLLMQAVGPARDIAPDFFTELAAPGDLYLLCSDGLHGTSSDEQIGAALVATHGRSLKERCAQMIDMAKRDGSRDNITVLLIECKG